jgi:hypothetical protein
MEPVTPTSSISIPTSTIFKGLGVSCVLAVVVNVVIFLIGNAGSPTQIVETTGQPAVDLTMGRLILVTIFALILGVLVLLLIKSRPKALGIWAVLVITVAFVTTGGPLSLDVDNASKLTLSVMHLTTGIAAVVGQRVVGQRVVGQRSPRSLQAQPD